MEIETYYTPDGGHQDNVFKLSDSEKQNRVVDLIDVVKDQVRPQSIKSKKASALFITYLASKASLLHWLIVQLTEDAAA